jgi:ribosomal protein L35
MPKAKTHKATAKRFQIKTSRRKGISILKRAEGQNHFNARESGNTKRNKRSDRTMSSTVEHIILRAIRNY